MDDEQEKKDEFKIKCFFINIDIIFSHLKIVKNHFFKFEEDIEKNEIDISSNDNTQFAYVSAFSTHFYAFYDVLKDLNKNLENIYRYYAYRLNNTQSLLDQLNFPVEINNYLKHRYDYQQYINEMNNYLYEKTKKHYFCF